MLVRFYKSSFPAQFIALGIAGLIPWVVACLIPVKMPSPDMPAPLYSILYTALSSVPCIPALAGFLLVFFEAVLVNHILTRHDLVEKNSSLTALIFFLLMSFLPAYLTLTPVNLVMILILLIIKGMFEAYNLNEPIESVYTAGFFTGLAFLVYVPVILLTGFLMITFFLYRTLKWREWVSSLIGLCTPLLFLVVISFLTDSLPQTIDHYITYFSTLRINFPHPGLTEFTLMGFVILMTLPGMISAFRHRGEYTVEIRKKNLALIWITIWLVGAFFLSGSFYMYHPSLLAAGLSPLIAGYGMKLRKPFWFEIVIRVFILFILINLAINLIR
jgi:hypothetical protein